MKVLALVDAPDHVCCRYRIRAFEPALRRRGAVLRVAGIPSGTLARASWLARLPRHDVAILQRRLLPGWQLRLLRRRAGRLIFDFDDAVLFRDSYDPRGPHSLRRMRRFARVVRLADAVLAGNDFLADCALRAGATPDRVHVIPTCIPTERYASRPTSGEPADGGLELVWIGSSSTLQGLEQSRPLWDRIGREVPGVRLRLICDRFPDLGAMPVVPVAWSEATEADELARGDVGVTWVPDDLWSRGKCGLKVLQYGAAGLPTVANPVGVHAEILRPGVNGFLPRTEEEWVGSVRRLATDPDLRRRLGAGARAVVESGYSVAAWEGAFVAAVAPEEAAAEGDPAAPTSRARLGRAPISAQQGRSSVEARRATGGVARPRSGGES